MIRPPGLDPAAIPIGGQGPSSLRQAPFADAIANVPEGTSSQPALAENASESTWASALSSTDGGATLVLQLQVQPVGDGDIVRIGGVPWGLSARGDFSQLVRGDSSVRPIGPAGAPALHIFMDALPTSPTTTTSGSSDAHRRVLKMYASQPGANLSNPSFDAGVDGVFEASLADATPESAASRPWLERMCRWVLEQGSEIAVFLRDYRLDERTARAVAEALRHQAQAHGVGVRRVVWNGHELWRASEHHPPRGEG